MAIYNAFAKGLCLGYKAFHPGWKTEGALPADPTVYVVHHQNMFGPVHTIGLLPTEAHMWSLHCFVDRQKCFDQYYEYTFLVRFGWPKAFAYISAKVLSYVVPWTLNSLRVIPVYHDATSVKTMRESLAALGRGESLVICPDVDYASTSPYIGEMYPGFFRLAQMYPKRAAGKALPFTPLYVSRYLRKIIVGDAMYLDAALPYDEAQAALEANLAGWINTMADTCGDAKAAPEK